MRNLMLSRFCIRRTYHQLFQKSSSVVCRGYFQLVRCEVGRMASEAEVRKVWRSADAVCFDVDSTVCVDEAIDELAAFLGKGQQVAQLTSQAMGGSMTYKDSLRRRLEIMQPSRQNVKDFISQHPPKLTQGVRELVKLLRKRNVPVYLISGGFTAIIESVADELNIPHQLIYANIITYDKEGNYSGFDEDQPTCQSGGKPLVIQKLKDSHGYKQLVHVGDGATDMEACPPADAFIGFGGNQVREKVKVGSKWFVMNIQEMIDELHLLSEPSLHVLN